MVEKASKRFELYCWEEASGEKVVLSDTGYLIGSDEREVLEESRNIEEEE